MKRITNIATTKARTRKTMGLMGTVGVAVLSLTAPALSQQPPRDPASPSQQPQPQAQQPQRPPRGEATDRPAQSPDELTVNGCLTARADGKRFVLTPLKKDPLSSEMQTRTTDVAPTYTYELIGGRDLSAHVGQVVSVTGTLDRDYKPEAEIAQPKREREEGAPKPGEPKPNVKTQEKAELEIRRLQVKTVDSTGKSCAPGS